MTPFVHAASSSASFLLYSERRRFDASSSSVFLSVSALVAAGAKDGQISTASYGEEKPVATGHDESAWAQNRRAEISYDIAK